MLTIRLDATSEGDLERAATILRAGGLVAFPTETVYGLGARGLDEAAVERIFAAKGRPRSDPLILHVGEPGWLAELVREVPPTAARLMREFWPGPLTLVLPKSGRVPARVTAGLDSAAVRMPAHPVALELIRRVGEPLAAPSANLFGHTSPTTAAHVLQDLDGRIDAVLDGGPTRVGLESTVLDLRSETPIVLRPGGVSRAALEAALGHRVPLRAELPGAAETGEAAASPGLLTRHYSPRARVRLFDGETEPVIRAIRCAAATDSPAAILAFAEDAPHLTGLPARVIDLGSRDDLEAVARGLYAAMRAADDAGIEALFLRTAPPGGLGDAINDRLLRAASGVCERVSG